ncbi:hypothetical protein VNO80_32294 [Phaseolus coccineus]|uniref:Uncharacterized protein n=1 Tax=Phaseolus coccineus TaxID=3886 RepID=A0AAN9KZR2_PHACN
MPRASNGQTRIPLVATLPWVSDHVPCAAYLPKGIRVCWQIVFPSGPPHAVQVSEDPKVTHVVRPVLATMHGQGGTRGGTVLSDAVHALDLGLGRSVRLWCAPVGRPFCRRCAPGLNWPGRASGAVTLKKLECSKQAYALDTLAWDNTTGF